MELIDYVCNDGLIDSYVDGISETVSANMYLLGFGFALIILYLSFAMGRFNWIEQRVIDSYFTSLLSLSDIIQADLKRLQRILDINSKK